MTSLSVLWRTLSTASPAPAGSVQNQFPPATVHLRARAPPARLDATLRSSCGILQQLRPANGCKNRLLRLLGLASQCSRQLRIVSSISWRTDAIRLRGVAADQLKPVGTPVCNGIKLLQACLASAGAQMRGFLVAACSRSQRLCSACSDWSSNPVHPNPTHSPQRGDQRGARG